MSPHLVVPCAIVWALVLTGLTSTLLAAWRADRARSWLGVGLAALCAVAGIAGSVSALRGAYTVVANADPAQKATLLAAGTAEALGPAQVGWMGAAAILAVALVGLWRARTVGSGA